MRNSYIPLIIGLSLLFAIGFNPVFGQGTVTVPSGTSVPGCEESNSCYSPYWITIDAGDEVTWYNSDTAAHTVTSGTPSGGADGIFDSSLFMAGATFSHKFNSPGIYEYLCLVHPWMTGVVEVESAPVVSYPSSYSSADINIPRDTSVPGCEEYNGCYSPYSFSVEEGTAVSWYNADAAIHTVTSGTPSNGPDGSFDSSSLLAGSYFSHKFDHSGNYNYFCMVHPWMEGVITVTAPPPPTISVRTSYSSYESGDEIDISGSVSRILSGVPVSLTVVGPDGNLVTIVQVEVSSYGNFSTELTAGGSLMRDKGTYTVKVLYGSASTTAETTFRYDGSTSYSAPSSNAISVSGTNFSVGYDISGGRILEIIPDLDANSVIVRISPTGYGSVTLTLPRSLIDAKMGSSDDGFFVLVNGEEVSFYESKTSTERVLTIDFTSRTDDIEIIGTFVDAGYSSSSYSSPTSSPTYPPSSYSADVTATRGSSVPGCEEHNNCYSPETLRVGKTSTVTWYNADSAAHTVTSGYSDRGPDGTFDSSLFMAGATFSHKFDREGTYPYFCMVHPWMEGKIIVQRGGTILGAPDYTPNTRDNTSPKILKPTDIEVDAENNTGIRVDYKVLAIDETDELVTPSCNPRSGATFSVGDTKVTCNAMDKAGNRATPVSFTVTVNPPKVQIPDWVKNVAGFWCDGNIEDASFVEGIQYLIDNNIIVVKSSAASGSGSQSIPEWIKNNACWWSQGFISDEDFAGGIEFLVKTGIIRV